MFKSLGDLFKSDKFSNYKKFDERNKSSIDDAFDFLSLINLWPTIVGERLSLHTCPLKNQYKTLTVLTNHSAFSQQLNLMEQAIIKNIEKEIPELKNKIKKINFIFNEAHFKATKERLAKQAVIKRQAAKKEPPKEKLHRFSPEYRQAMEEAEALLSEIEDQELKEQLKSIFLQMKQS